MCDIKGKGAKPNPNGWKRKKLETQWLVSYVCEFRHPSGLKHGETRFHLVWCDSLGRPLLLHVCCCFRHNNNNNNNNYNSNSYSNTNNNSNDNSNNTKTIYLCLFHFQLLVLPLNFNSEYSVRLESLVPLELTSSWVVIVVVLVV